jgi:hypothetical protein
LILKVYIKEINREFLKREKREVEVKRRLLWQEEVE